MNDDLLDPLGPYDPEIGQAIRWCLGPLTLELGRRLGEWRVAWRRSDDLTASDWSCEGLGDDVTVCRVSKREGVAMGVASTADELFDGEALRTDGVLW